MKILPESRRRPAMSAVTILTLVSILLLLVGTKFLSGAAWMGGVQVWLFNVYTRSRGETNE